MPSAGSALAAWLLLLSCALGLANAALAADEIHWTITGQTSVTFDWRGTGAEDAIWYGTSPGVYTDAVIAATPSPLPWSSSGPFWEAKLIALQENTLYYYVIGNGPEQTFRTPPPRGSSRFTVYAEGDIGSTNTHAPVAVVQGLVASGLPAFALMVGDLTYGDTKGQDDVDQHFNDVMVWSREAAYMPAWGNHEWAVGDDLRNYKGRFDLPNPQTSPGSPAVSCCGDDWYWFDYGNVRFIAYPEPWSTTTWSDWSSMAKTVMDRAQADPAITFIVTFGHRPAYSSGLIGGDSTLRGYLDALGDRHSKYVLNVNGHSHNYERTLPQHGVVHLTVGTGGTSVTPLGTAQPWSVFRAMRLGALRLHFTATGIEGAFICGPVGIGGTDVDCALGSVVDSFTIGTVGEDLSPPAVKITAPASSATVFRTTTVTAVAADNVGVAGVQFQLDGSALGGEATTAPYAVAWDTTTATDGAHVLRAVARDAAGNMTTSAEVPVIVDNDVIVLAFPPAEDATIKYDDQTLGSDGQPCGSTCNYGFGLALHADKAGPKQDFLMKFSVSGIGTRAVLGASLRLHTLQSTTAGSEQGGDFYRVADNTWSESTVTWDTAPAADPAALASLGAVIIDTWVEVDLTPLITGDGEFGLRVASSSDNGVDYYSKDYRAGVFAPQLVVTVAQVAHQAPNGMIETPAGNVTIQAGRSVSFTGTGTAPDQNLPLTYLWTFGVGASDATVEDPGPVVFATPGVYTVTFTVTDRNGLADPTPAKRVITVAPPGPADPTNLTATPVSSSQINLAWTDNASNESGFKIERSANGGSIFVQIATVGSNHATYSNTSLTAGTYTYRVRAYNTIGNSDYSNTASAATLPVAPSSLTAKAVSSSQVNLAWKDASGNEDGFRIERCQGASCTSFVHVATVGVNATSYADTVPAASTSYSYRVRAYNTGGNSAYSSKASVVVVAAPGNLTATAVSSAKITLAWTDNASNEKGFKIERCSGVDCTNFVQIATVSANVSSYANTGLTASTTYTYRVRAYNTNSDSDNSNTAGAATP